MNPMPTRDNDLETVPQQVDQRLDDRQAEPETILPSNRRQCPEPDEFVENG